jgi:hypothetical protein
MIDVLERNTTMAERLSQSSEQQGHDIRSGLERISRDFTEAIRELRR